jgi:patatin-like phospholipase/acyl hydrolase
VDNAAAWKNLRARYEQDRPHRMLALDGGGIRGLLTLGILEKIEQMVAANSGGRLCDFFDYIGGTSTGAIIAAGLARGMTTADVIDFYRSSGRQMFEQARLIERASTFYTADPLKLKLQDDLFISSLSESRGSASASSAFSRFSQAPMAMNASRTA